MKTNLHVINENFDQFRVYKNGVSILLSDCDLYSVLQMFPEIEEYTIFKTDGKIKRLFRLRAK